MKKYELQAYLKTEIDQAYNGSTGDLSDQLGKSLDYYLGKPLGTEEDGKSQVISRDVIDVIEWVMPSLMRVFTSTDRAVIFDPVGPEDEEQAKQETDIVNYVFYKENDGFINLYTFFKDALLSKNGIVKVYWDPSKKTEREEYKGLTEGEMQYLLIDPDIDPIEHTDNMDGTHDITVIRTTSRGQAKVSPVPPEEFLISKETNSIFPRDARFTAHRTLKTRSELIEMGFSKTKVNKLNTWKGSAWYTNQTRDKRGFSDDGLGLEAIEDSMDLIEVYECYYKVDFDGDGIAELRQITLGGGEILLNEQTDRNPFIAITPIIMTHRFYGLSIADIVMDIQLIKSTLMRIILDNNYIANWGKTGIQEGMVNMEDLLTGGVRGVVRTLGRPMDCIMPMPYNPLPSQTFDVLGMMDSMRKERTGVSQDSMGLEGNVLAHGRTGVISQSFDMARMRTELIARIFAEVGVKNIMLELHAILQKNQEKKKWVQLRGKWVEINPCEWKKRYNMTINVGIGTGNKDSQTQSIMAVLAMQEKLMSVGGGRGVTEQNIYNALEKLVEFSGLGDVSKYFTDPSTQPPPQPQPNVEEELAKAQVLLTQQQVETQKVEAETNRQEMIWKHQEAMEKIIRDDQTKRYDIELKYRFNVPGGLPSVPGYPTSNVA